MAAELEPIVSQWYRDRDNDLYVSILDMHDRQCVYLCRG